MRYFSLTWAAGLSGRMAAKDLKAVCTVSDSVLPVCLMMSIIWRVKMGSDLSRDFNGIFTIEAAAFMPDAITIALLEYSALPMTGTLDSNRAMILMSLKSNRLRRKAVLKRSKPKAMNLNVVMHISISKETNENREPSHRNELLP